MAIAALEAGKHVWCEKPMAIRHEDARAMAEAARQAGRVAVLGYNYIQNPMMRLAKTLIDEGRIGEIVQIRLEMDEDFMADPEALFYWKSEAGSGYGAPDDFAVHPLSLLHMLVGPVDRLVSDMAKPYEKRPQKDGPPRKVETYDIASMLFRAAGGVSGTLQVNRAAWGRKGRIALQIFGSEGSMVYDQERMNELQLYVSGGAEREEGFRTILAGPAHSPYGQFIPAPGHGLGFNDLKVIECREMIRAIDGEPAHIVDFAAGLVIEDTVHAMAQSFESRNWVSLGTGGSHGNL
jgi:predicted dehydrogenase